MDMHRFIHLCCVDKFGSVDMHNVHTVFSCIFVIN